MRLKGLRVIAYLLWALLVGVAPLAAAQEGSADEAAAAMPWQGLFDEAVERGRSAYNTEDFPAARDAFVEAIQHAPEEPAGYRNLARTYYWMGDYAAATAYYEEYLRLAPQAEDRETIEQERRATASRSDGEMWTTPSDQRMALAAMERELEDGRGLTPGGGGAWGLFQTVLRMGYAAPELAEYRRRLEQKIWAEFDAALAPEEGFLPLLRRQEWDLQASRLEALSELTRRPGGIDVVRRRGLVVEAVQSLLNGRYERADAQAREAAAENVDLPWVGWYRVVALEQGRRPQAALEVLNNLVESGVFPDQQERRVSVLQAHLMQQLDRGEEAAKIYRQVLLGSN